MTVEVAPPPPAVLIAEARVRRAERISPAFVRVTLESAAFDSLGIEGFDTRLKVVFPGPTGELPGPADTPEDWYAAWREMPDATRSPMRTYTVRDVVEEAGDRLLVIDFVVHEGGVQGPACRWALAARPGDVVEVVAPHRGSREYGGTEFAPGDRRDLLLVADETALPALTRILTDVSPDVRGRAFVEVPTAEDVLALDTPPAINVTWLVRDGAEHGRRLAAAVRGFLGLVIPDLSTLSTPSRSSVEVEIWETPRFSSSGEDIAAGRPHPPLRPDLRELYAWIAGESWLVQTLRRSLVSELGVPRAQVAFMGYWRQGVSMRA